MEKETFDKVRYIIESDKEGALAGINSECGRLDYVVFTLSKAVLELEKEIEELKAARDG